MENIAEVTPTPSVTQMVEQDFRPEGVSPFAYGLWRHFVLLGALHLIWLFVLLLAQMAGYHGFDPFIINFLGLGGR
tara:strand:- start:1425 stop:1652 length:228 start_codon:yes stop_codon:yes gene_type:complete